MSEFEKKVESSREEALLELNKRLLADATSAATELFQDDVEAYKKALHQLSLLLVTAGAAVPALCLPETLVRAVERHFHRLRRELEAQVVNNADARATMHAWHGELQRLQTANQQWEQAARVQADMFAREKAQLQDELAAARARQAPTETAAWGRTCVVVQFEDLCSSTGTPPVWSFNLRCIPGYFRNRLRPGYSTEQAKRPDGSFLEEESRSSPTCSYFVWMNGSNHEPALWVQNVPSSGGHWAMQCLLKALAQQDQEEARLHYLPKQQPVVAAAAEVGATVEVGTTQTEPQTKRLQFCAAFVEHCQTVGSVAAVCKDARDVTCDERIYARPYPCVYQFKTSSGQSWTLRGSTVEKREVGYEVLISIHPLGRSGDGISFWYPHEQLIVEEVEVNLPIGEAGQWVRPREPVARG